MKLAEHPDSLILAGQSMSIVDDFETYTTTQRWTTVKDSTPTVAAAAGTTRQSELQFTTGATDNDEAYASGTVKFLRLAADRPIYLEWDWNVPAVSVANNVGGLSSIGTADFLVNDGGGPASNYNGCVFYKVDGNLNWFVEVSATTTQSTVELTATNSLDGVAHAAAGSYQKFRVEFVPTSSTKADVGFFIDNILVYKFWDWTFTAANVSPTFGVKAGDTNSLAVMQIDYAAWNQRRG